MEAYAIERQEIYPQGQKVFQKLIKCLSMLEGTATEHFELESMLEKKGREVCRTLMEEFLNIQGDLRSAEPVVGMDGVERTHVRLGARNLETLFGTVRVWRESYGQRGVKGLRPLDSHLNLPKEVHSHGVRRRIAEECSKGSYDEAVETMSSHTGAKVSKYKALELAEACATDFDAFYEGRCEQVDVAKPSVSEEESILVLTTDAAGVVMRPEGLREATRKRASKSRHKLGKRLSQGEKRNRKRMAQVAAVYMVAPFVRTSGQIIGELGPDGRPTPERPRPQNKRVWASVEKPARDVIEGAFVEAHKRDSHHTMTWTALVDGNKDQLRYLKQLAVSFGVTLTIVVDVIHVLEYLWKAAWAFHEKGDPEAERWVSHRLRGLLEGKVSTVAGGIRRSATLRGLKGKERKAVDKCCDYLLKYKSYLRYDQYLAKGLPIATGVIEGACRYLIRDRMDITGARWSLKGAEAVLKLRALRKNGDFEQYWRFHLDREKERNHLQHYKNGLPNLTMPEMTEPKLRSTNVPYLKLVA